MERYQQSPGVVKLQAGGAVLTNQAGCQPGLFFLLASLDRSVHLPFTLIPDNPPPDVPEEIEDGGHCGHGKEGFRNIHRQTPLPINRRKRRPRADFAGSQILSHPGMSNHLPLSESSGDPMLSSSALSTIFRSSFLASRPFLSHCRSAADASAALLGSTRHRFAALPPPNLAM